MSQYSIGGLVVTTRVGTLTDVASQLSKFPGVEVHHREPSTHRLVLTMESGSPECDGQNDEERLDDLRRVPGVVNVSLLYQYVGEPDERDAGVTHASRGAL